jgi:hypothetical protein
MLFTITRKLFSQVFVARAVIMQTVTISAKSHNVRQLFLNLISFSKEKHFDSHPHVSSSAVVDCLERFLLWTGKTGAMRNSQTPLSLDQRLLQAADIREQINRQLEEIEEAINECESPVALMLSYLIYMQYRKSVVIQNQLEVLLLMKIPALQ